MLSGTFYFATDDNGGTLYRSDGASWTQVARGVTQTPPAHKDTHKSGGSDALASTDLLEALIKRIRESGGADLLVGSIVDGEFLKRSGTSLVSGSPAPKAKVGTTSVAASNGNTAVTGAGFTPKLVIMIGKDVAGLNLWAVGAATSSTVRFGFFSEVNVVTTSLGRFGDDGGGNFITVDLVSFDSDGFTYSRTITGAPSASTTGYILIG